MLTACIGDDKAQITVPTAPIAVGAYYPLDVTDACSGGGKISFCSSEGVISFDTIEVDDPRVASVLRMSDLDAALRVPYYNLVVDAKGPGKTKLEVSATFSDGSHRQASAAITTEKADRMELVHLCRAQNAEAENLFAPGAEVDLSVGLFHGDTGLLGEYHQPLLEGEGIVRIPGYLETNNYRFTASSGPQVVSLASPSFRNFAMKFRVYDVAELHIDSLVPRYDLSESMSYGSSVHLDFTAKVAGKIPCYLPAVQLETLSPEICGGGGGATTWAADPSYGLSVKVLKSGTCQLVASIPGSSQTYPLNVDILVDPPTPVYVDPCEGITCDANIDSCPDGSELVKENCCNACAPVPDVTLCEAERAVWDTLFDTNRVGSTACVFDSDCTTAVLVGGCRRYCYLPVAAQQIAPFMNAISQAYYTSCPHCAVANPATCTNGPTAFRCEQGECLLYP